jgi:hypothetical protein
MRKFLMPAMLVAVAVAAPAFAGGPDTPPPPPSQCIPGGPGAGGPHAGGPGAMPPHMQLAEMLAAAEPGIGIRSGQLDAWRQYTDALQAVLRPPAPPAPPAPGTGGPAPFTFSAAVATDMMEKSKKAEALLAAIDNLRKTLTPEQLERAKMFDLLPPSGGPRPSAPPR